MRTDSVSRQLSDIVGSSRWRAHALERRFPQIAAGAAALTSAQAVWEGAVKTRNLARSRFGYSVSVPGDDAIFTEVHAWLRRQSSTELRSTTVATSRHSPGDTGEIAYHHGSRPDRAARGKVALIYNGDQTQRVRVEGHRVEVTIHREEPSWSSRSDSSEAAKSRTRIVFSSMTLAAHRAVLALIQDIADDFYRDDRPPGFYIADRWGDGFRRLAEVPPRPLSSVVLPRGVMETLLRDMERFLASEDAYARMGQPWHRGYLLPGPPRVGKTSVLRAAAGHFGLDVYHLPLNHPELTDADLIRLVAGLPPRAVLGLEDIDLIAQARKRDEQAEKDTEQRGITLSGLLNALDGITTPHGLIAFLLTNDEGALDEALTGPGRVDLRLPIGYAIIDQAIRLGAVVWERGPDVRSFESSLLDRLGGLDPATQTRCPTAAFVEVCKRHLDDPGTAGDEVGKAILADLVDREVLADL